MTASQLANTAIADLFRTQKNFVYKKRPPGNNPASLVFAYVSAGIII